ncbi:MAG TPA: carbohydrate ABC transporter permease [Ideonella sp.]|nr:carbohydrate ABC transporter permease [Ideonella sp.]
MNAGTHIAAKPVGQGQASAAPSGASPTAGASAGANLRPAARNVRPQRSHFTPARLGVYALLLSSAAFFLLPLYVMLTTSLKPMEEIRLGNLFALPLHATIDPWIQAWSSACTGLDCSGIQVGFWNSVKIVVPSTVISIFFGALNGYALSFWRVKWAGWLFGILMFGAFVPYQVMIFPLVRALAAVNLFGSLPGIVLIHTVFGMPVMTLLFRNYYAGVPVELFKAARIDGGGFWRIFFQLMLPMSLPIIAVAVIMQLTNIWNDFLLGLVFAGRENLPMTVQLNNVINTTTGERLYNVNMAATILTSMVPLVIYLVSGRWFVRGIAAGAVKG